MRNRIYQQHQYCFKTARAIATLGNDELPHTTIWARFRSAPSNAPTRRPSCRSSTPRVARNRTRRAKAFAGLILTSDDEPIAEPAARLRPARREHPAISRAPCARRACRSALARVLDALEGGRGGGDRRSRRFLCDAACDLRQEARTFDPVRSGVPHFLAAQGLSGKAHRDDVAAGQSDQAEKAEGGGRREPRRRRFVQEPAATNEKAAPSLDLDARFTMSAAEVLQTKDFAQMSAAEIARAQRIDRAADAAGRSRRDAPPFRQRAWAPRSIRAARSAARCATAARSSTSPFARRPCAIRRSSRSATYRAR